jgi:hypothetical protein
MRFLAALLLLCPAFAWGQSVTLPAEIKGAVGQFIEVAAVSDDATIKWHSVDAGLNLFPQRLLKDTKIAVVTALVPGRYRVMAVSAKGDVPSDFALCTVVVGNPGPGPQPPPEPPVPPGPEPPPNPPNAGPRQLLIFRESADDTPLQKLTFSGLQFGIQSSYLKSKGHAFFLYDDDDKDSQGNPAAIVEQWRPHFTGMAYPVLVIVDKKSGAIVHKTSLDAKASADDVLTILKQHGG